MKCIHCNKEITIMVYKIVLNVWETPDIQPSLPEDIPPEPLN